LNQFRKDMPWAVALEQFLERARRDRTQEFEEAIFKYYTMIHPKADDSDPKENYVEDFINDIYWAIGQHHGLKTPLLDWTMDPYKALFFAICQRKEKNDRRVVFGLAEKSRLLLHKKHTIKRYIELLTNLDFVRTILDSSGSPLGFQEMKPMFERITAQNGIFTHSLHVEDVEKHAKRCYDCYKKCRKEEIIFIIRIMIPDCVREGFLEKLEGKNITYKTMFPDLQGAALHCNLKLDFG